MLYNNTVILASCVWLSIFTQGLQGFLVTSLPSLYLSQVTNVLSNSFNGRAMCLKIGPCAAFSSLQALSTCVHPVLRSDSRTRLWSNRVSLDVRTLRNAGGSIASALCRNCMCQTFTEDDAATAESLDRGFASGYVRIGRQIGFEYVFVRRWMPRWKISAAAPRSWKLTSRPSVYQYTNKGL